MSEPCSTRAYTLLLVFMLSSLSPLVSADSTEEPTESVIADEFVPVFADIDDFTSTDAHPYMIPDSDQMLFSATRLMKQTWVDEGMPGVEICLLYSSPSPRDS